MFLTAARRLRLMHMTLDGALAAFAALDSADLQERRAA
jgi:hypothetical protein